MINDTDNFLIGYIIGNILHIPIENSWVIRINDNTIQINQSFATYNNNNIKVEIE